MNDKQRERVTLALELLTAAAAVDLAQTFDTDVLNERRAQEAREAIDKAIEFLGRIE